MHKRRQMKTSVISKPDDKTHVESATHSGCTCWNTYPIVKGDTECLCRKSSWVVAATIVKQRCCFAVVQCGSFSFEGAFQFPKHLKITRGYVRSCWVCTNHLNWQCAVWHCHGEQYWLYHPALLVSFLRERTAATVSPWSRSSKRNGSYSTKRTAFLQLRPFSFF